MGILTEERRVVCSSCSFVFCRLCLQGFHIGDCNQAGPGAGVRPFFFVSDVAAKYACVCPLQVIFMNTLIIPSKGGPC
jgi:hypothetical protein